MSEDIFRNVSWHHLTLSEWQARVAATLVNLCCTAGQSEFTGSYHIARTPDQVVAHRAGTELHQSGSQRKLRECRNDFVLLIYLKAGDVHFSHGKFDGLVRGKAFLIIDAELPHELAMSDSFDQYALRLQKSRFIALHRSSPCLIEAAVAADNPEVAAAAGVLEAASGLGNALPRAYETMAETVVKLLCDRVDLKSPSEGKAAARRGALWFQMLKTLEDHFSDPTLTATTLAARIGISRRYLDALFVDINLTFAETLMERRLRFAIASLGHPHGAHRPITEIANASGFRDMSPRQARNTPDRLAPLDR